MFDKLFYQCLNVNMCCASCQYYYIKHFHFYAALYCNLYFYFDLC